MPLELTITNEQKINVKLNPTTSGGKPAAVEGAPVWSVIDATDTSSMLSVANDGLSADLISNDTPGDTIFMVVADADLGTGVVELIDTIRLTVNGALAANLGLVPGTPVNK